MVSEVNFCACSLIRSISCDKHGYNGWLRADICGHLRTLCNVVKQLLETAKTETTNKNPKNLPMFRCVRITECVGLWQTRLDMPTRLLKMCMMKTRATVWDLKLRSSGETSRFRASWKKPGKFSGLLVKAYKEVWDQVHYYYYYYFYYYYQIVII